MELTKMHSQIYSIYVHYEVIDTVIDTKNVRK